MAFLLLFSAGRVPQPDSRQGPPESWVQEQPALEQRLRYTAAAYGLSRVVLQEGLALAADQRVQVCELRRGQATYLACFSGCVLFARAKRLQTS